MVTKVSNMISDKGNLIENQFILKDYSTDKVEKHTTLVGKAFQSYDSVIAFKPCNSLKIYLDVNKWDYSNTTAKYRNRFLGMTTAEVKRSIKDGDIKLVDLNN